jgi:hypothetical protein
MKKTHNFPQELAKNADEFVVHELAAFKCRFLESFDLLLHNNLEGSRPDEEGRS